MPQYILSLSYGKDSLACLGAIKHLGWPLDRIVTADVWATDEIPAEYPPVVAFKAYVDKYIEENFGIIVEHYCATRVDGVTREKVTYEDGFYHTMQSGKHTGSIKGFPMQQGPWCQKLKLDAVKQAEKMTYEKLFYSVRESGYRQGQIVGFPFIGHPECQKRLKIRALEKLTRELQKSDQVIQYLGIAADESDRIASYIDRDDVLLPLVELGWEEDLCGLWCKYSGLLSPTYDSAERETAAGFVTIKASISCAIFVGCTLNYGRCSCPGTLTALSRSSLAGPCMTSTNASAWRTRARCPSIILSAGT